MMSFKRGLFKSRWGNIAGSLLSISVGLLLPLAFATGPALSQEMLKALKQPPENQMRTQQLKLKQGNVYYVIIPKAYSVQPVVSEQLQRLDGFLKDEPRALAMINAGYFDPENQKTISYITINGKVTADPTQNERLTGNLKLKPYLPKIFNRSEFRMYICREGRRYDIVPHEATTPSGCTLRHALGGGPSILPEDHSLEEAVVDYDKNRQLIRDPFGIHHANARSAIGITPAGSVVLLMIGQNPTQQAYGMNFEQVRSLLSSLGATKAMMLDGGSSSSFWLKGLPSDALNVTTDKASNEVVEESKKEESSTADVIYGKFNKEGQAVKRPVKSVLVVLPPQ